MDKFQVVELTEQFNHAGTKATEDITVVAERFGFKKLNLQMRTTRQGYIAKIQRQIGYILDWNNCYKTITRGSIVLLQHPFQYAQMTREKQLYKLKKSKKVKFISVVHDIEELRVFRYNHYYKREFEVMSAIADVIIVHNEVMKQFLIERGVNAERLVSLEIFDYLQENTDKYVAFEKAITIAGNLDTTKCQYIGQLGELQNIKVNLYGPNYNKKLNDYDNVTYHGSFPVDEIPKKLIAGFGLVWDGESIDGCKGLSGQYLKYNNPHKLSLYLSSGIPVVIWKEAAEAAFVKRHGVGICVESLRELDSVLESFSKNEYDEMVAKVQLLRNELINGDYAYKSIASAIEIIKA